jgi:hypothetical protein
MGDPFPLWPEQENQIGLPSPCIICRTDEWVSFGLNRSQAAAAAVAMSRIDPYDPINGVLTEELVSMPSAMFMSLAYYAGGLPMLPAWKAHAKETGTTQRRLVLEGSSIWQNHTDNSGVGVTSSAAWEWFPVRGTAGKEIGGDRLLALMAGNLTYDYLAPPLPLMDPTHALWVSRSMFVNDQFNVVAGHPELPNLAPQLLSVFPGDYLYYEASVGGTAHGAMVVGYGPLIDWEDFLAAPGATVSLSPTSGMYALSSAHEWLPTAPSSRDEGKVRNYANRFPAGMVVPYVCDWWNGIARMQGPRPFYATATSQTTLSHWIFVSPRNSFVVRCQEALERSCEGADLYINPAGTTTRDIIQMLSTLTYVQ